VALNGKNNPVNNPVKYTSAEKGSGVKMTVMFIRLFHDTVSTVAVM
jgi:hypothetical protein